MGESLVELGDEESGESNLPGWKLEAGWTLEWGRGRWKGRRVPWLLAPVLELLEEHWRVEGRWVDGKVELWEWVRRVEEGRTGMGKRKD